MRKLLFIWLVFFSAYALKAQEDRISKIKHQLENIAIDNEGYSEQIKTEVSLSKVTLGNFLLALAELHNLNINVAPELNQITLVNNFTNVTVADVLVYLSKEYNLDIDFTGNILSIKKVIPLVIEPEPKLIPVSYNKDANTLSLDVKQDALYDVFKKIMDVSGKNLFFAADLERYPLTSYMVQAPFETAMQKLAYENNLYVQKNNEGFYIFEKIDANANGSAGQPSGKSRLGNFYFKVLDPNSELLAVDFTNTPIASIIYDIGNALNIDMFVATPLDKAGTATFKASEITFEELLNKIFEAQKKTKDSGSNPNANGGRPNPNGNANPEVIYSYKYENNVYYFGVEEQLSVRNVEVVQLYHRSVQLLQDPSGSISSTSNNNYNNTTYSNNGVNGNFNNNNGNNRNYSNRNNNTTPSVNNLKKQDLDDLTSLIPEEVMEGLSIKTDYELNRFYVSGPSKGIERFANFVQEIDKPVPVVLIEIMILEVSKSASVDTGVSWGLGTESTTTTGEMFPEANVTLGAETINKIIGGFDGFGSFNLGKVVPNFYLTIKAMEANGNVKIKTAPKLATLNGHMATFSNGNSTYYAVTDRYVYGNDNPQTSVITNYVQIDVQLGLYIKPYVSDDGQVTLDMKVVQSDFGNRIEENAPPDIISKEFSSIIRVKDQDIVILGGLEVKSKNDSGEGVPLLARIPIIKWLFSRRTRSDVKSKLSVLIKPTVIR